MSKTPIEMMLDGVTWVQTTGSSTDNKPSDDGELYAAHEGMLEIAGHKMRCYRLSNGIAVFNADDFEQFFASLSGDQQP